MMRLLTAGFLLTISTGLSAQVMWQVKKGTSQVWYLSQTDEFNDNKVNPDIWKSLSSAHPYQTALDLYYKADNIHYGQGYVSLQARKETTIAQVELSPEEAQALERRGKGLSTAGDYSFDYSGALLTSRALYHSGYFEMRFKMTDQPGVWPSLSLSGGKDGGSIALFSANGADDDQVYTGVPCLTGCTAISAMYTKKGFGAFTKLSEPLSKDWNIISAEWGMDYITYFINGKPVAYYHGIVTAGKELVLSNGVSRK